MATPGLGESENNGDEKVTLYFSKLQTLFLMEWALSTYAKTRVFCSRKLELWNGVIVTLVADVVSRVWGLNKKF